MPKPLLKAQMFFSHGDVREFVVLFLDVSGKAAVETLVKERDWKNGEMSAKEVSDDKRTRTYIAGESHDCSF